MIYFINPISHVNVGDIAIFYATNKFLIKNNLKYVLINPLNSRDVIFTDSDILLICGGGWLGLYNYGDYQYIKRIMKKFPGKIILMPNSFIPENDDYKIIEDIKATIFARDPISAENYKMHFKNSIVQICSDIVYFLDKIRLSNEVSNTIGIYARTDIEKDNNLLEQDIGIFENRFTYPPIILNNDLKYIERFLINYLMKMNMYKYIITDALHMSIFAYLINKPCICLDTKYKKLSNTWNQYNYTHFKFYNDSYDIKDYDISFTDIQFNFYPLLKELVVI